MKLTKNSVSIVENIVDFTCALVFKDEVKAFEMETQESAVNASNYLSAYLKTDSLSELERKRVIDDYKELNSYYKSLLDEYGIQPYISRLAKDLDIIYQPEKMVLTYSYLYYYRAIYKQCLQSFYVTSYSPAMITKDNYREFCLLSINLMAFTQLINRWLENPYDINLMTEFQIDKFMISFGVSFFTGLPFKYKQIIARNLNRLIINKGTDKVIIDILELFGFAEININKYYLIRQAVSNQDSLNDVLDFRESNDHDVFFISHNINLPSLNHAIKNDLYTKYPYEQIVGSDEYWKVSKEEVKSLDFNFIETKYFSIDTGFNLNVEVMNTTLIINLLKRIRTDYETKERLEVLSNIINETVPAKVEDIIITLQILMCEYQGLEDNIQYELAGIAKTYEFAKYDPLNANINLMNQIPKIKDIGDIKLADLRTYSRFDEPEILEVYNQNIKVKENMEALISSETNYQDYKKIRSAHNAKFYQTLNYNMFGKHPTFTSYLRTRNSSLHNIVSAIRGINDTVEKNKALENMISNLTDIVTDTLQNFSIFLGATSLDILLSYMRTAILAFKSFTTSLLDLNVFIIVADKHETRLMDSLEYINANFEHKSDFSKFEDTLKLRAKHKNTTNLLINDRSKFLTTNTLYERPLQPTLSFDKIVLGSYFFKRSNISNRDTYRLNGDLNLQTDNKNWDIIISNSKNIHSERPVNIHNTLNFDNIRTLSSFRKNTLIASFDVIKKNSLLTSSSTINYFEKFYFKGNSKLKDVLINKESLIFNNVINTRSVTEFYDKINFSLTNIYTDRLYVYDRIRIFKDRFFKENEYFLTDNYKKLITLIIKNNGKIYDFYNVLTASSISEISNLRDNLFFHTTSTKLYFSLPPILNESIKFLRYGINHSEKLIFSDTILSSNTLNIQEKIHLNDTCIVTQVTYG